MSAIYWNSGKNLPQKCQLNNCDITNKPFVDGKTQQGPWAIMCVPCHRKHGWGLGLGRGQQYDANGRKVGG